MLLVFDYFVASLIYVRFLLIPLSVLYVRMGGARIMLHVEHCRLGCLR